MTVIGEVFVAIRPQTGNFEADLHKGVTPGATKVAKTLGLAIGGAFVVSKIRDFGKAGIDELKAAEAAHAQTAQAIKSTGGAANVTADEVEALAGQQMRLTGVDDELIQKGENLLLTFTRVRNEVGQGNDIFNQATVAALDLSRAGFGSVESASVLLGKALNDPVQGLTALQRVGVRLTDGQKETVKQLVATGDVLGAQKVILEEVNTQVGGSAKAYGETLPGKLAIAQESLANTKGMLVAGMAPALTLTAGAATFMTEQFAKQPQVLQQVEGGLLLTVGALGAVVTPLKAGIDLWRSFGTGAKAAADTTAAGGAVSRAAAASLDAHTASTGRLVTATTGLAGPTLVAAGGMEAEAIAAAQASGAVGALGAAEATATSAIAGHATAATVAAGATASQAISAQQASLFTQNLGAVSAEAAGGAQQLALFSGEAAGKVGTLDAAARAGAGAAGDLMVATRKVNLAQLGTDAQNSASSVEGLYSSSRRLGGGLSTVKTAALNLGIQLGILAIAMQLLDDNADHVDLTQLKKDLLDLKDAGGEAGLSGQDIKKLSDAIEQITKPSVRTQLNNITAGIGSLGKSSNDLSQARATVDDFDKALASLAQQDPKAAAAALKAITSELSPEDGKRLLTLLNDYDSAVAGVEVSSRLAADGIDEVGGAAVDAGAEVGGLAGSVDALVGGVREVDSVTGLAERSTKRYAEEMADAREAMDLLFGSTTSAIGSSLDYRDAVDGSTDALAELILAEAQGKTGTDEYRRMVDDAARALFGQAQAASETAVQQYALAGVTLTAGQQSAIQRDELIRLRDTLAPNHPLRVHLQGMIDQLGLVVSKQVTVDVNVAQAMANVAALAGQVNQLTDQYLQYTVGSVFKAKGGPVGLPAYRAVGGSASQLAMSGGPRGTDTIPAWLTPGEFVFQKSAVDRLGLGVLNALNRGTHTLDAGGNTWVHLTFGPGSVVLPPMRDTRDAYLYGAEFADGVRERLAERSLTVQTRAQA